ncbi:hypothetical protein FQR65_LT04195 [Abscondita terminalis]|nr:hypothetical protein FQR65_LT04195 [Abscondita terminalis]
MSTRNQEVLNPKLQNCLKNVMRSLEITNYVLNISRNQEPGENHLGIIISVEVIDEESKKINMVIKNGPKSLVYRNFFPIHSVFIRESYVYRTVLPEFERFQKNTNSFGYFPKYYDCILDIGNESILLEDVKELGYKSLSREVSLNYNHALLVVRELGKLHAISFALRDQDHDVFMKLSQNLEESYYSKFECIDAITDCYAKFTEAASNTLNKLQDFEIFQKIDRFKNQFYKTLCEITLSKDCGEYSVICHGDVWVGNLLFKYFPDGVPQSVCFLDWQLARYGSPVLDLSQFLFTCTEKSLRDEHYHDLINAYYTSLHDYMQQLGSNPEKWFPMTALNEHLKKYSLYGLCMAIHVLWTNVNVPKDDFYDTDTTTTQDVEKVVDHFNKPPIDAYTFRMRDVILDFFNFGYELLNCLVQNTSPTGHNAQWTQRPIFCCSDRYLGHNALLQLLDTTPNLDVSPTSIFGYNAQFGHIAYFVTWTHRPLQRLDLTPTWTQRLIRFMDTTPNLDTSLNSLYVASNRSGQCV